MAIFNQTATSGC